MKRIFVCSPLKAIPAPHGACYSTGRSREENIDLAERLCRAVVNEGHAPFAPHAFYTRFLNDAREDHRERGMEAGRVWLLEAHEVWVYDRLGVSDGMKSEIKLAALRSIPVLYLRDMPVSMFAGVYP